MNKALTLLAIPFLIMTMVCTFMVFIPFVNDYGHLILWVSLILVGLGIVGLGILCVNAYGQWVERNEVENELLKAEAELQRATSDTEFAKRAELLATVNKRNEEANKLRSDVEIDRQMLELKASALWEALQEAQAGKLYVTDVGQLKFGSYASLMKEANKPILNSENIDDTDDYNDGAVSFTDLMEKPLDRIFIYGTQGSGKSTLTRHMVDYYLAKDYNVMAINPHASGEDITPYPSSVPVIGDGFRYDLITHFLMVIFSQQVKSRMLDRATKEDTVLIIEEFGGIVENCNLDDTFYSTLFRDLRKAKIKLIAINQGNTAKSMGMQGRMDLLNSFQLTIACSGGSVLRPNVPRTYNAFDGFSHNPRLDMLVSITDVNNHTGYASILTNVNADIEAHMHSTKSGSNGPQNAKKEAHKGNENATHNGSDNHVIIAGELPDNITDFTLAIRKAYREWTKLNSGLPTIGQVCNQANKTRGTKVYKRIALVLDNSGLPYVAKT